MITLQCVSFYTDAFTFSHVVHVHVFVFNIQLIGQFFGLGRAGNEVTAQELGSEMKGAMVVTSSTPTSKGYKTCFYLD